MRESAMATRARPSRTSRDRDTSSGSHGKRVLAPDRWHFSLRSRQLQRLAVGHGLCKVRFPTTGADACCPKRPSPSGKIDAGHELEHATLIAEKTAEFGIAKRRAFAHRLVNGLSILGELEITRRISPSPSGIPGLANFSRARLHLLEQPRVLDGDHGLVAKVGHQLDLFADKRPSIAAQSDERTERNSFVQQGHAQDCSEFPDALPCVRVPKILGIFQDI